MSFHFRKKEPFQAVFSLKGSLFSIAGKGFEPHDLRVMSPTSYQTALPRDIQFINRACRTPGSNRYVTFVTRDFKSRASANSATPAHFPLRGFPLLLIYYITSSLLCQPPFQKFFEKFQKARLRSETNKWFGAARMLFLVLGRLIVQLFESEAHK